MNNNTIDKLNNKVLELEKIISIKTDIVKEKVLELEEKEKELSETKLNLNDKIKQSNELSDSIRKLQTDLIVGKEKLDDIINDGQKYIKQFSDKVKNQITTIDNCILNIPKYYEKLGHKLTL